ncbi:HNH endonuclease [Posidoniimonas polymericola]|uniref:HNH endonuclease n=1 Tax=Posidoniimonas polymericola TaxID=2528002 RepID=UPI0037046137
MVPDGKNPRKDIANANKAYGKPGKYNWSEELGEPHTWHHDSRRGVMLLVPTAVHEKVGHSGGAKLWGGGYK